MPFWLSRTVKLSFALKSASELSRTRLPSLTARPLLTRNCTVTVSPTFFAASAGVSTPSGRFSSAGAGLSSFLSSFFGALGGSFFCGVSRLSGKVCFSVISPARSRSCRPTTGSAAAQSTVTTPKWSP